MVSWEALVCMRGGQSPSTFVVLRHKATEGTRWSPMSVPSAVPSCLAKRAIGVTTRGPNHLGTTTTVATSVDAE